MIATVVMVAGALIWLAGELYAAFSGETTTSGYIRHFQQKWPWLRLVVVVALVVLGLHFEVGFLGMRWSGPS